MSLLLFLLLFILELAHFYEVFLQNIRKFVIDLYILFVKNYPKCFIVKLTVRIVSLLADQEKSVPMLERGIRIYARRSTCKGKDPY